MFKILLIILIIVVFLGYKLHQNNIRETLIVEDTASYENVLNAPIQSNLTGDPIDYQDYTLYPVAIYQITARVLSKKKYSINQYFVPAPVDLALGWGRLSDLRSISDAQIKISQNNRHYFWQVPNFKVINRKTIETSSANNHIIPMDNEIASELDTIEVNDVVYLSGYLVNVKNNKNNGSWKTSMTRNDVGDGACEIIYVQEVKIFKPDEKDA